MGITDNRRNWKKILGALIAAIVGFFIVRLFWNSREQCIQSLKYIGWIDVMLGSVCFLAYLYARAVSWILLLHSLGGKLGWRDGLYSWFSGEIARYIPGNVWSFAGRLYLASSRGASKTLVMASMALEISVMLPSALILSIPALQANGGRIDIRTAGIASALAIIVFLIFVAIGRRNGFFAKKLAGFREIRIASWRNFFAGIFFQLGSWLCFGVGSYALIRPFSAGNHMSIFVSDSILAWLVGYVSIVTPMGLGVREGIVIILLAPIIGETPAGLTAVLSRVILTASEGMNVLPWIVVGKWNGSLKNTRMK